MSDRRKTGEDIFRLPPASLLRVPTCEDDPVEGGGVDNDAESEMGDGEEEMTGIGVPTHDASSTATTGSNLLYLSDQVCYMYMYVIDRTCKNSSNTCTCTLYIHDILCTLGDCVYCIVVPISVLLDIMYTSPHGRSRVTGKTSRVVAMTSPWRTRTKRTTDFSILPSLTGSLSTLIGRCRPQG